MTLSSLRRMHQVLVMGLAHAETTAMGAWGLGLACESILVCPPSLPASPLPRTGMLTPPSPSPPCLPPAQVRNVDPSPSPLPPPCLPASPLPRSGMLNPPSPLPPCLPRSGMMNLAPTSTGSATAIALIFPELKVWRVKRVGGEGACPV